MAELWFAHRRRSCSPPTSCSTASTSAPARCTSSSPGPTPSAGRSWRRSGPSGTATRSGCSPPAARCSSPFPRVLASGLSGFYFAIFLVLWLLILRGIAIEFRSHVEDAALARGLGRRLRRREPAAAGALRRRARQPPARPAARRPRAGSRSRSSPTFSAAAPVGILDWYTVLAGVFALLAHRRPRRRCSWRGRPTATCRRAAVVRRAGVRCRRHRLAAADRGHRHGESVAAGAILPHRPLAWLSLGLAADRIGERRARTAPRSRSGGVPGVVRVSRRHARRPRPRVCSRSCCVRSTTRPDRSPRSTPPRRRPACARPSAGGRSGAAGRGVFRLRLSLPPRQGGGGDRPRRLPTSAQRRLKLASRAIA